MARTPHVLFNSTSSSVHMNEVVDRIVQVFDDVAERDTQMPGGAGPDGAMCRTLADGLLWTIQAGVWEPFSSTDEVWVGPDAPTDPATELWFDDDAVPPVLYAKQGGTWVPIGGTDEVWVGPDDPYAATGQGSWEVWFNTTFTPGVLYVRWPAGPGGTWIPGTVAVNEVSVGTADPAADPAVEIWYDTTRSPHGVLRVRNGATWEQINEVRQGGTTGQVLTKRSDFDHDTIWSDAVVPLPATTGTPEVDYDQQPSVGVSIEYARADHTHGTPHAEVAVGDTDPYIGATTPVSYDWWFDTSTTPYRTWVREPGGPAGQWIAVSLSDFGIPTDPISMGGFPITDLPGPPVDPTDAVNKEYVDALITGLSWKEAVLAASIPGEVVDVATGGEGIVLDGYTTVAGNRVLVKDNTDQTTNGIYRVEAGPWVRSPDADSATELDSAAVFIAGGDTQSGQTWVSQTDDTLVIGTDPILWVQQGGGAPPLGDTVQEVEPGKVPTAGVALEGSRADHVHRMPPWASGVEAGTEYGETPVVGVLDYFARSDHSHGTPPRELPPGGAVGDSLVKATGTDYDVEWSTGITAEHEVAISPTDPMPGDPLVELWYTPGVAPPVNPPALWDAAVTYAAGDWCQWPTDVEHWRTTRATVGEEPGTTLPTNPADEGLTFGGPDQFQIGGFPATPLSPGFDATAGFDLRLDSGGMFGTGDILLVNGVFQASIASGSFGVIARDVSGPQASVPLPAARWMRCVVNAAGAEFFSSADGITWASLGAPTAYPLPTYGAGTLYLGNAGGSNSAYGGQLNSVQIYDAAGAAPMQSWVMATQPGPLGAGVSPLTGETYGAPVNCTDAPPVAATNPWVAVPAPPATGSAGILRANVGGIWEDVATGGGAEETHVGPDDPAGTVPTVEFWYDTDDDTQGADDFLPLAGGTMESGAVIAFPNQADVPKINLYADTFGLGIEGGTLTLFASQRLRLRAGTPADAARGGITSPEIFVVEADVLRLNGKNVPRFKTITKDIETGKYYRIAGGSGGVYGTTAARWSFGVSRGSSVQAASGVAVYGNAGGNEGSFALTATSEGGKTFDQIVSMFDGQQGAQLCLRAAVTATITIGFEVVHLANGNGYAAWDMGEDSGTIYGSAAL